MEKRYTIPVETYKKELTLVITDDTDRSVRKIDEELGAEPDNSISYFAVTLSYVKNGVSKYYIVLGTDCLDAGTVAHETMHATFRMLDSVGIDFGMENQEPFAYLQEYLVGEVHKCIDKFIVMQKRQQKLKTKRKKRA